MHITLYSIYFKLKLTIKKWIFIETELTTNLTLVKTINIKNKSKVAMKKVDGDKSNRTYAFWLPTALSPTSSKQEQNRTHVVFLSLPSSADSHSFLSFFSKVFLTFPLWIIFFYLNSLLSHSAAPNITTAPTLLYIVWGYPSNDLSF